MATHPCPFGLAFKVLIASFLILPLRSAEPIRAVDLAISALVYDPLTAKLYGAGTNNLLQIDPDSGEVLRAWDMGSRIVRLELGAGGGIWAAINRAVRRFNLETLTLEEQIEVPGEIFDLSPSQSEPYTVAFSTPPIPSRYQLGWLIKNGVLLPDSIFGTYVAVSGSYFFRDNWRYPIGPNGIVNSGYVGTPAGYRMKPFAGYIYSQAGTIFHANTLQPAEGSGRVGGPFAINPAENAAYYLSDSEKGWQLDRLEHPTARQTGHHVFPRFEPLGGNETVAAWSTNRVAFHSPTKLYLVDTTDLFGPGDVEVLQTVPSGVKVGEHYEIAMTVTNRGPGAALYVTFEHAISSGIPVAISPSLNGLTTLEPGQSVDLQVRILATDALTATNTLTVSTSNDPDPANNSSVGLVQIGRNTGRIVQLPFISSAIAYDSRHSRLFFTPGGELWMYDPDLAQLRRVSGYNDFQALEISQTGGTLWVMHPGTWRLALRVDTGTFAQTPVTVLGDPIHDIAISPANPSIAAISTAQGTTVLNGPGFLPNGIAEQGNVAFSADGTRLYFVDAADCTLSVYQVDPAAGMILERRGTNVACGDFIVSGNRLYFKHGPVYDATSGQRTTNSLNVTPPAFVVPRGETYFDLLNRTNGAWVLRRLSASTHAPVMTVPLDASLGAPLDMVGMDADTVAIRTTGGPILLVDLTDWETLRAQLGFSGNQLSLSFYSTAGATYRIERSESIVTPSWTIVRDNIAGTGDRIDEVISTNGASASFYRLVRLAG